LEAERLSVTFENQGGSNVNWPPPCKLGLCLGISEKMPALISILEPIVTDEKI